MAEHLPEAKDPIERYDAIERAYSAQEWPQVLERGPRMLADLEGRDDPLAQGLRQRLQLLLGHTHLHGRGDREAARACYEAALGAGAESSLRQIAEEGLRQCERLGSAAAEPPPEPAPAALQVIEEPAPPQASQPAAMPWLESGPARAPLIPEVVEEPELIEVHQADPRLAENLDVVVRDAGRESATPGEDADLLAGLLRVVIR